MLLNRFYKRVFGAGLMVFLLTTMVCVASAFGQNTALSDQGVVLPPVTVPVGRQDATALLEIRAYQKAVHAGAWVGMQAQGSFTPNAVGATGNPIGAEQATLWILGHRGFRLDIQSPTGTKSLRTDSGYGAVRRANGRTQVIDARNAFAGFLAFPALMTTRFPASNVTLIDQGIVDVDGAALHRITIGEPWPGTVGATHAQQHISITDLYFDPRTNLLEISATAAVAPNSDPTRYLRVIEYSDYQETNGVLLPLRFTERLNGQLLWTLQLSSVQLQPGLDDSGFHF